MVEDSQANRPPSRANTLRRAAAYARTLRSHPWGHLHVAVADWLDAVAYTMEQHAGENVIVGSQTHALTVARAYLGESA